MSKIGVVFAIVLLAGYVQAGERLTGDELRQFYTDTTLFNVHPKLGPGKTYFGPDGGVHSKSESGKERIGKWWIESGSDKRCIRWDNKNEDFCHYTERNDNGTHTLVHGRDGKRLVEIKSTQKGNRL